MKPYSLEPRVLPQSARRLRDEPVDTATQIVEQFGGRGPTSLGEAQAAAYFDGRLRRAGMKVSADAFLAPTWNGWDGTVLALWVLAAIVLYRWQPLLALVLQLVAAAFVAFLWLRQGVPLLVEKQPSQNVIGTRALAQRPSKRIVVLAPLDAPTQIPRLLQAIFLGQPIMLGRSVACLLVVGLGLAGMFVGSLDGRYICWLLQFVPAAYLLVAAFTDWWLRRAPCSPGAIHHAGALAALLACAEELTAARGIELWAVAIGASESGAGLTDLLRRYPFEVASTRFIVLESLGAGSLAYITRSGVLRSITSDPTLLTHAAAVDADDPLINAAPQPLRHTPSLLERLRRKSWHAIGVSSLDAEGMPPFRASAADTPDRLDADVLDRAVRLVLGIVRRLDD